MQVRAPHPIMVRRAPGRWKHIMVARAMPGRPGTAGTMVTAIVASTLVLVGAFSGAYN